MPKIKLSDSTVNTIKDICAEFENKESELINVLHKTQGKLGYLPAEVQEVIAKELKSSIARVYGVVTFYSFFSIFLPQLAGLSEKTQAEIYKTNPLYNLLVMFEVFLWYLYLQKSKRVKATYSNGGPAST